MKIIWLHTETVEVPGVGLMEPGEEYNVPDMVGLDFLSRGLATQVKAAPKKEKTLTVED